MPVCDSRRCGRGDSKGRPKAHEALDPGIDWPHTRPRSVDLNRATEALPSLRPKSEPPEGSILSATGTDKFMSHSSPICPTDEASLGQDQPVADVIDGSNHLASMVGLSPEMTGNAGHRRVGSGAVGNTGVGTRTPDLRIMSRPSAIGASHVTR